MIRLDYSKISELFHPFKGYITYFNVAISDQDTSIHLVFSAFTSRPISLLASVVVLYVRFQSVHEHHQHTPEADAYH